MKLSWTNVSAITMDLFSSYRNNPSLDVYAFRPQVYRVYRTSCQRVVLAHEAGALNQHQTLWTTKAAQVASEGLNSDQRQLQVQGPRRAGNAFLHPRQVRPDDTIISIMHIVHQEPIIARLQITVCTDCCGPLLYSILQGWLSSVGVVSQWKVMNPTDGAQGPDSAVIGSVANFHLS